MSFGLIYPAIIVFSLVCIALILTVLGFKQIKKDHPDQENDENEKAQR